MSYPLSATDPSATAGAPSAGSSNAGSTSDDIGLDKQAFLELLVAQLKYQNPLSPTDGTQYMAQLAQFATVEQLTNIAQAQQESGTWQRALAGTDMVGKQVTGAGPGGAPVTGLVTGLQLGAAGPTLLLAGGGTLPVDAVEVVQTAGSTAPPTAG